MKNRIHAYHLPLAEYYTVLKLPKGARFLKVDLNLIQGGVPTVWALVDTEQPQQEYRVLCRIDVGQDIGHDLDELCLIGHTIGLGKSIGTMPGSMTPRNTFWMEAHGKAAQHYVDLHNAMEGLKP